MADEISAEVPVVAVVETEQTEIQVVRIGGAAGVRVTQTSVGSPTVVKRVNNLNDADRAVQIGRALLEELRKLAESSDDDPSEALAKIRDILPVN